MIERIYYRVKLNTDQIIYAQHIDANILEAKLNENIIKDPSKTYLIWGYTQFPADSSNAEFKAPAGCTIDWGDGEVQTFDTDSTEVTTHTYSDGISYHLISLSNVNIIKNSSFKGCFWLKGAYISNEVTNIEDNAFNGCKRITTVSIGANVEYIGNRAFYGCSDLTNVIIPDSVTSIGDYAFDYCNRLKTIKVLSTTPPPTLGSKVFYAIEKIIVPKSAINTYKSAAGWSTYADKIVYEVDSSDLDTRIPDTEKGKANGVATLDASGKVPSSQLPSYVDDVINGYIVGSTPFAADWLSLTAGGAPLTPEEGKIYVIISEGAYSNNSYRWSGTVYAPVGSPIAVVQGTGQSTTDVMSQKAVTDAINAAVTTALNTEV